MDLYPCVGVKELVPAFWAVEWKGCPWRLQGGGPAGTQALLSGFAGVAAQVKLKPLLAVSGSQILRWK